VIFALIRRTGVVLLLLACLHNVAHAEDPALTQLVNNAEYWEKRGRSDRAKDAWQRVLRAYPDDARALTWLGKHAARTGKVADAKKYRDQLRATHPKDPGIAQIEQALNSGANYGRLLSEARAAAAAGRRAEAITLYQQAFGSSGPPEDVAVEYFQTLSGAERGWDEARKGLAAAASRAGEHSKAQLAYGQHLTYREPTRRQGIAILRDLAGDPALGTQARSAWRQALIWLSAGSSDLGYYDSYLALSPDDADVQRKRDNAVKRQRHISAQNEAEQLASMGVAAMEQRDFARAQEIFERVKTMAPTRNELWENSLRSATFWSLFHQAAERRREHRLGEAEATLKKAIAVSPNESVHARVALAELQLDRGAVIDGEAGLRSILQEEPNQVGALRALAHLTATTSRLDEALVLNKQLEAVAPDQAWARGTLEAEGLRAEAAQKRGSHPEEARDLLVAAREGDPRNLWVLHDLAGLQLDLDSPEQAEVTIAELEQLEPNLPELQLLRVRQLESAGKYEAALAQLQANPRLSDENWRAARQRLDVQVTIAQLVSRARRGSLQPSRQQLLELQRKVQNTEQAVPVALAWADLGDNPRAIALADDVRKRFPDLKPGPRLMLAAVYLRTEREQEFSELVGDLALEPTLSIRERNDLTRMQVAQAVRSADKLRSNGQLESALARLEPLAREYPDNVKLQCAVARIYNDAGEHKQSYELFRRVIEQAPDEPEARQGAVQASLAMFDKNTARQLALDGIQRKRQDPQMHLIAGRYHVMVGDEGEALEEFEYARKLVDKRASGLDSDLLAGSGSTSNKLTAGSLFPKLQSQRASDSSDAVLDEINEEIDRLNAKRAISVGAAFRFKNRSGYGGFGGLTILSAEVEAIIPVGFSSKLRLSAEPLLLDTGKVDLGDRNTSDRLGTYALDPSSVPSQPFTRTANGTRLAASFTWNGGLTVDIGSTVLGAPLATVVGGVAFRRQLGRLGFAVEGSRRQVEESYLSIVGMRDPLTRIQWGRILREGGRADLALTAESVTFYVIGSYARVVGERVPENKTWLGGVGVEWKLYDLNEQRITAGVAGTYLGYDKNLRYFTLGQGGYFSPQQFFHAGLPIAWRGHTGPVQWDTRADVGINWFKEEDTLFYPLDPQRQLALVQARQTEPATTTGEMLDSSFHGQTVVSAALDLSARASYQVSSNLETGLEFGWRSADWFREVYGGIFIRNRFNPKPLSVRSGL